VQAVQRAQIKKITTRACKNCSAEGHDRDAKYCKFCGVAL
jgi:voltage-gated potassium channel